MLLEMVVTFSLCTGYSSHHHPPWLHGTWLTSLNQEEFLRICPQQQHQILWVQQGHPQRVPSHSLLSGSTPSTFRIQPEMQSWVKLCSKIIEHPIRSFLSLHDKHTLKVAQWVLRHPTHALSTPLSSFILCFFVCHLLFDCVRQLNCPPWE